MPSRKTLTYFLLLIVLGSCKKSSKHSLIKTMFETALLEAESDNGNPYTSLQLFKKIVNNPYTPEYIKTQAINNMAIILCKLGDDTTAHTLWSSLTTHESYMCQEVAFYNLGLLAFKKNDIVQAVSYFEQAIEREPLYTDAHFYCGLCLYKLNQLSAAREHLYKVLNHAPTHEAARYVIELIGER